MYNGVPRNKIREKYNISKGSLDAIAQLNNYKSVASELNDTILHKKKRENEKRDFQILELLQKGLSNTQISNKLQISKNIVEKVKYKYPNLRFKNKDIRIKNYNMVQQLKEKGYRFLLDSPTNQQFVILENKFMEELKKSVKFNFWEKYDKDHTVVRFATSWSTKMENVEKLINLL